MRKFIDDPDSGMDDSQHTIRKTKQQKIHQAMRREAEIRDEERREKPDSEGSDLDGFIVPDDDNEAGNLYDARRKLAEIFNDRNRGTNAFHDRTGRRLLTRLKRNSDTVTMPDMPQDEWDAINSRLRREYTTTVYGPSQYNNDSDTDDDPMTEDEPLKEEPRITTLVPKRRINPELIKEKKVMGVVEPPKPDVDPFADDSPFRLGNMDPLANPPNPPPQQPQKKIWISEEEDARMDKIYPRRKWFPLSKSKPDPPPNWLPWIIPKDKPNAIMTDSDLIREWERRAQEKREKEPPPQEIKEQKVEGISVVKKEPTNKPAATDWGTMFFG